MDSPSNELDLRSNDTQDIENKEESSTSFNDTQDIENKEESSTSEKSDNFSTFDLVKKAISEQSDEGNQEKKQSDENKEDSDKEDSGENKEDSDKEDSDEPTEEELNAWKPKTRKRFEQLQGKYRETNDKLQEVTQKLQDAEVHADYYKQYTSFLDENNLSRDDANKLFNIGAMVKNDPVEALKAITPIYNELLEIAGEVLPNDLQQQVNDGYITEEYARELSRSRALNRNYEQKQNQQYYNIQYQKQVENQNKIFNEIQIAINAKEKLWQNDPDYQTKEQRVRDCVKLALYEAKNNGSFPQSKIDVNNMLDKIKSEVDKEFMQLRPKKQVVHPVDSGSSVNHKPEPNTTEDVIRYTLGG